MQRDIIMEAELLAKSDDLASPLADARQLVAELRPTRLRAEMFVPGEVIIELRRAVLADSLTAAIDRWPEHLEIAPSNLDFNEAKGYVTCFEDDRPARGFTLTDFTAGFAEVIWDPGATLIHDLNSVIAPPDRILLSARAYDHLALRWNVLVAATELAAAVEPACALADSLDAVAVAIGPSSTHPGCHWISLATLEPVPDPGSDLREAMSAIIAHRVPQAADRRWIEADGRAVVRLDGPVAEVAGRMLMDPFHWSDMPIRQTQVDLDTTRLTGDVVLNAGVHVPTEDLGTAILAARPLAAELGVTRFNAARCDPAGMRRGVVLEFHRLTAGDTWGDALGAWPDIMEVRRDLIEVPESGESLRAFEEDRGFRGGTLYSFSGWTAEYDRRVRTERLHPLDSAVDAVDRFSSVMPAESEHLILRWNVLFAGADMDAAIERAGVLAGQLQAIGCEINPSLARPGHHWISLSCEEPVQVAPDRLRETIMMVVAQRVPDAWELSWAELPDRVAIRLDCGLGSVVEVAGCMDHDPFSARDDFH
ncbi:hypothetical protein D5S17_07305 [Pseudonocardiaceae bacterium YIM PH 21723]|nr:hypothetical protein D5S17_07305 [Pseudonocardiaceae bacterium YIM PH 21723]